MNKIFIIGWIEDLFLNDDAKTATFVARVRYVKIGYIFD